MRWFKTSRMLTMPTRRWSSTTGRWRMFRARMVDATSAILSPGEHVMTVFVISAETGSLCCLQPLVRVVGMRVERLGQCIICRWLQNSDIVPIPRSIPHHRPGKVALSGHGCDAEMHKKAQASGSKPGGIYGRYMIFAGNRRGDAKHLMLLFSDIFCGCRMRNY